MLHSRKHKKKNSKPKMCEFLAYHMNEGFTVVEAKNMENAKDEYHPLNIIDETCDIDPIIMRHIRDYL